MNGFEILVPLAAIMVAGTAVILPIAGITARFALKPVVEAIARIRAAGTAEAQAGLVEQRLALLEEQFHALERDHARLLEEVEFQRQLGAPPS